MNLLDTIKQSQKKFVHIKTFNKGNVLFRENDRCESIGIIINGKISIVSYLINGNEIIYNQLKENDVFGNNLIFSSEPYYKGNIIVDVDSKIAFIKKNDLIGLLSNNNSFLLEYLKINANFSKALNNRIKLLSIESAEERLYFYMHEYKNVIEYTSISELAKQLNLKRETLSRLISKLEKQKKIKKNNKTITLL